MTTFSSLHHSIHFLPWMMMMMMSDEPFTLFSSSYFNNLDDKRREEKLFFLLSFELKLIKYFVSVIRLSDT
jgi:hypothetical protein